jgi:ATP-dependent RNA helicase RhlE
LTDYAQKQDLLMWIMSEKQIKNVLVFAKTKHRADKLAQKLSNAKISSASIHGDKSQGARQNALNNFKANRIRVLVATDIAARGIDIDDLAYVINYDLPNEPETYVHRIGRTGRAGKSGIAISLCDFDEKPYLKDIQKLIKKDIPEIIEHPYPMTVFQKRDKPKRPQRKKR